MKRAFPVVIPVLLLALSAGCGSARTVAPTAAPTTASASPTKTAEPSPAETIAPTRAPTATKTPRPAWPAFSGSKILMPDAAIGPDNAGRVVELARWGFGYAYDAAFSPDGSLLASASTLGLRLYDAETLEPGLPLEAAGIITHIAFAPDGRTLAAADSEGAVRLWDTASGAQTRELPYEPEHAIRVVESLAYSPDGGIIAAGSYERIVIWDAADGDILRVFDGISGADDLAFSPDGGWIASVAADETVELRDTATGELVRSFAQSVAEDWELYEARSPAFSPDGSLLAAGFTGGKIKAWRTADGSEAFTLAGHDDLVASLAFSPDGKQLVSGSWDLGVVLWNIVAGTPLWKKTVHDDDVIRVAFRPDGESAYSVSADLSIVRWDASTGDVGALMRVPNPDMTISKFAFSPDGAMLGSVGWKKILLWDVTTGTAQREIQAESEFLGPFAFSPDGKYLASGSNTVGGVSLWNFQTGLRVKILDSDIGRVFDLSFSSNGTRLAAVAQYSGVALWDTAGWRKIYSLGTSEWTDYEHGYGAVALSPDGSLLAAGRGDGSIVVLHSPSGEVMWNGNAHEDSIIGLVFSPDGKFMASEDDDGKIVLWDAAAGSDLRALVLGGRLRNSSCIAFSPDGKILAMVPAILDPGSIQLWDTAAMKSVRTIANPKEDFTKAFGIGEGVISLAFSPDGKLLASGSADGVLQIWGVPPG